MTFCFILKHKITLFYLPLFVSTRFITRCHLLSLIVIFCYSLSFVVTRCHPKSLVSILCHSLYCSLSLVVPLAVTPCHSLYHSLPYVVTCCTILFRPLSLDVSLVCLFVNDQKASRVILIYQIVCCHNSRDFEE